MFSEEINQKIDAWEQELKSLTRNPKVRLVPLIEEAKEIKLSLSDVVETVSFVTNVPEETLFGKSRKREHVIGRQLIYLFGQEYCFETDATIGDFVNRDRSTVIHGRDTIKSLIKTGDPQYVPVFSQVKTFLEKVKERMAQGA